METTPRFKKVVVFIALATLDLVFQATAGAVAVVVGAHYNGLAKNSIPYLDMVALGALAGAMKSVRDAIWTPARRWAGVHRVKLFLITLIFGASFFCVLVTAVVCRIVGRNVPVALLNATLIGSGPLILEFVDREAFNGWLGTRRGWISLIIADALAGVIFAELARSQGYKICALGAAATAGAAFGTLSAARVNVIMLIEAFHVRTYTDSEGLQDHVTSLVGNWENDEKLPIDEETQDL